MKLQNNFTTLEQSKRLLAIGVPEDTADLFYNGWLFLVYRDERYNNSVFFDTHPECVPCWSVGRLLEIALICADDYKGSPVFCIQRDALKYGLIECIIGYLIISKHENNLDFLKLEINYE